MSSFFKSRQMAQLISVHFKEIVREPGVLFWGIGFPLLMALGLGVAFSRKPEVVRHVAYVESRTEEIIARHAKKSGAGPYKITTGDSVLGKTTFVFEKASWREAMVLLKRGSVSIVLAEKEGKVQYHFDPLNPDAQLGYLNLSRLLDGTPVAQEKPAGNVVPLDAIGTRYIDFLVPGLMAMGIMMACLWGISYGIIDKRGKKLLRRMVATPMRRSYFLVSLFAVRMAMNVVESGLLFIFAHFVFGITVQGSVAALCVLFLAGNIAFAGVSVFISCRTSNTEIGNGLISAISMPMMVLSGVFFSYHNFPEWSIPVIRRFPLTLLADSLRSVFIEGAGLSQVLMPAAVLTVIGVVLFFAGLRVFRWH